MSAQTITPPASTRLQYSQLRSSVSTAGRASSADVDRLVQILQHQDKDDLKHKLEHFSVKELSGALVNGPLDLVGWEGEPPSLAAAEEALEVMKTRLIRPIYPLNSGYTNMDPALLSGSCSGGSPELAGWNQNQNGSTSTITRPPDNFVQGTDREGYYEEKYDPRNQMTGNPDDLYAGLGNQDGLPYQDKKFGYANVPTQTWDHSIVVQEEGEEEDEADQDKLERMLSPEYEETFFSWSSGLPQLNGLDDVTKAQIGMDAWFTAKRMVTESGR
ncbi:hypothetical protein M231_04897 [Tremella mesenterica]|uniref:Uncharacterized protein n=1 Tax=Tremella mesenterica TaxID=5217 RepID=A0A4Q1BJK5_TREME|nr:hypothetical protein M231_04897 [Tremella mesenterica]